MNVIAVLFIIRSLIYLKNGLFLLDAVSRQITSSLIIESFDSLQIFTLIKAAALFSQAILTLGGVILLTKSRKKAYQFFRNAVWISIFILQVFNFYTNPLLAIFSTTGDLLLLGILTSVISVEKSSK